ncbi:MAG: basic amino acid ABC transporter substrate-binding protein [Syntrophobacterales bacterium]|nr:basic amino acid ABC transporter substrate-binding protein [Syntrophobacterales bacterium]
MKVYRVTLVVIALFAMLVSPLMEAPAAAAAKKTITVATDATWPPMEFVNAQKKIVGLDIDFLKAVAKEGGFKVVFKNTAWDGIFAGIEAGKFDAIISSVTITDERKKTMDFSTPYINAGQILVVPKKDKATQKLADLKGKKVGAQIGTTGAMEVKKNAGVELKTYDEIGLAFEDMAAGRIAAVVCDTPVAANYALQREEYKKNFKIVGKPFTEEFYGVVVKKGNKELLEMINKGIEQVKAKGLNEAIEKKWLQ